jgi:hypothetical protein
MNPQESIQKSILSGGLEFSAGNAAEGIVSRHTDRRRVYRRSKLILGLLETVSPKYVNYAKGTWSDLDHMAEPLLENRLGTCSQN